MELQGLGSINLPLKNLGIQPGQKFLIEVINRDIGGKAQIRIGGQVIPALLEIPVQAGDKFWAGVQKADVSGILLVRDKDFNHIKGTLLDPQRVERLFIEFGSIRNNTLGDLLKQVLVSDGKGAAVVSEGKGAAVVSDGKGTPIVSDGKGTAVVSDGKGTAVVSDGKGTAVVSDGKGTAVVCDGKGAAVVSDAKGAAVVSDGKSTTVPNVGESIASFVHNNIPQWSDLGKDGFLPLLFLLRGLGLDYERRLKSLGTMENQDLKDLQGELKRSLKGILLSLLAVDEPTKDEKPLLTGLLERLTGQQILLQGGNTETPFYLLEIPLQADGEIYTQTLAIKASRKGKKLDHNHCRVALHADTPTLGELGLEGWLYEGKLTLRVFSDNPDFMQSLIEANFSQTSELFKQMGIILNPIGVAPLKSAEEFQRFLQGEFREGVNYQV